MKATYLITIILATLFSSANANELKLVAIGDGAKTKLYNTISTAKTARQFPALYVYNTQHQKFLSTEEVKVYLTRFSEQIFWPLLLEQWAKDSRTFSTSNALLSTSLPMLKLDREYLVFYDNLPVTMLEKFKSMDPELIVKDEEIKTVLGQLESARSYTTY